MEHSKLPWKDGRELTAHVIYSDDFDIAAVIDTIGPSDEANAAFIVKACNSFEAMKEALEAVLICADTKCDDCRFDNVCQKSGGDSITLILKALALANKEGE
ncbi:hypothetical protein KAR91_50890 [Candidatus Pacearchaeota archaeon]|nr:hypothetical protein [Candidatus Pacearchaeota archaeon]